MKYKLPELGARKNKMDDEVRFSPFVAVFIFLFAVSLGGAGFYFLKPSPEEVKINMRNVGSDWCKRFFCENIQQAKKAPKVDKKNAKSGKNKKQKVLPKDDKNVPKPPQA